MTFVTAVEAWLLCSLWAQGTLAIVLLCILGSRRLPLVAENKVAIRDIAVSSDAWPESAQLVSNAFNNQFQLPVLFFVAGFAALHLGPNLFELASAWIFVFTRFVHAAIHVTSNQVIQRFFAYAIGFGVLVAFWVELAVRLLFVIAGTS